MERESNRKHTIPRGRQTERCILSAAASVFECALVLFVLFVSIVSIAQTPDSSQIGYKSAPDADEKKTLLLKDFKPESMLHVPTHAVGRAKFYVIDVHNHTNDAQRIDDHMEPSRVVQIMDRTNVRTV